MEIWFSSLDPRRSASARSKGLCSNGLRPIGSWCTLALLGLVALGGTGCTGTTNPVVRPQGPSPEQIEMQRRMVEMEQRAIMGEVEAQRLRGEVKRLKVELAEAKEQAQRTAPPTTSPAQPIGDDIGTITVTPLVESVELEEPEPTELAPPMGDVGGGAATAGFVTGGTPVALESSSAQGIYDQGYALFHQRLYGEAEYVFGQVLAQYPEHDLADNALFWIGESRYARKDYGAALAAFTSTVQLYPEGNKVADAMLKAGKCLEGLGDYARAAETYREAQRLFPDSAAALVAEERLQALP